MRRVAVGEIVSVPTGTTPVNTKHINFTVITAGCEWDEESRTFRGPNGFEYSPVGAILSHLIERAD